VAARDEDERVRSRRTRDHVRLAPGQRLDNDTVGTGDQPRANELVTAGAPSQLGAQGATLEPW
jgi:hypothetical protein